MTESPSFSNSSAPSQEPRLDIARTLNPVARAIGLTRIAHGALIGFEVGATAGAVALLAAHFGSFDVSLPVGLLILALGVLAGAVFGLSRWPRAPEAARAADLYFGLEDRLTTALELRTSDDPVALVQSRDAADHIDGLTLTRSRGRWLRWNETGIVALAALAFAVGLALGPQTPAHYAAAAAAGQTNTQRVRHVAANQVQKLRSQLHLGLTPGQPQSAALRKLDRALAALHRQLLRSSSPRAALRAISATQQQLHQLALGLHPVNSKAVTQLNNSLSHYLNKGQNAGKKSSVARSTLSTAQALNRLAQSLVHLTPAQQAALARALAKAANATSNNSLRASLRQSASSLANGNPQSARSALQRAAQMLAQAARAQAAQLQAGTTSAQLGALKNQIAGLSGGPQSGQFPNQPGSLSLPARGQGTRGRKGQASGKGTSTGKGQGTKTGHGIQPGQGQGTGLRPGTRAGQGTGRR